MSDRERDVDPETRAVERKKSLRSAYIALGVLCVIMPLMWIFSVKHNARVMDTMVPAPPPLSVVEHEDEIQISPKDAARPTRHDVAFSIGSVIREAKICMGDYPGIALMSWNVNPDGSASDVRFEASPEMATASERLGKSCLPDVIEKARVAPFEGERVRVRYAFRR